MEANNMNPDQTDPDLGPYCLQYRLPKNISSHEEQKTKVMIGGLRVNPKLYHLYLDTNARKPVVGVCQQQRRRPACASAQSDQCLCYSLIGKKSYQNLLQPNFQFSS